MDDKEEAIRLKIKVFVAISEKGLEKKANKFLEDPSIHVKDIHYSSTIFSYSVLLTYE